MSPDSGVKGERISKMDTVVAFAFAFAFVRRQS